MPNKSKDPPLSDVFAENVRVQRTLRGWSQEALSERCGVNRNYIGALERAENDPRLSTVQKLANGLGTEPFKLLIPAKEQMAAGVEALAGMTRVKA
jgi:transcriptional regulator with XRE-family HTH domain